MCTMAKYIDREAFMQSMYHEAFEKDTDLQKWDGGCWIRYKLFENVMSATPSADVQPVRRGKWIIVDQGDTACLVECDQCGMHYIVANDVFDEWLASENRNYCPKCGAYMREKNGEEI